MEKTKKRKGKCTGQKRIKSNKQFGIPGRKQWADPHRLKAAWYKIVCKMRRLECDTASIRYSKGGFLSFYNKVYKYTYLFLGWLCRWFFSHFRGSDHSCSLAVLCNINIKYPFTTFALPIMHLVCPPPNSAYAWASICLRTTVTPRRNWEKIVTQTRAQTKCIMGNRKVANKPCRYMP